jgi:magnesium-transporting ATPase (P-type)
MRLVCVLLSIIVDVTVISAVGILLLGMIFDLAAVLVISFSGERRAVPDGDDIRRRIPGIRDVLRHGLIGCGAGIVSFASVCLVQHFTGAHIGQSGVGTTTAFTLSLMLTQLLLLSEFILGERTFYRSAQANYAYFIYAVLSLAVVLLFMFSDKFCYFMGDSCPSRIVSTVSAMAAVAVFAVCEIVKAVKIKKD